MRHGDTLARLGGDEFAVLLPSVRDREHAEVVAVRLRDALHRSFSAADATLDVEASIGVAMSPLHGTTPDALLANADIAMYSAKERKAGAVFFDPEDRVNTPTRLTSSATCAARSRPRTSSRCTSSRSTPSTTSA